MGVVAHSTSTKEVAEVEKTLAEVLEVEACHHHHQHCR